ncbi:MAG: hypothetical protein DI616_12905 [Paracoccus denitrificans]|uniref:Sulphotransferase Stf0 domain-containing protein n=1 Tax=Paracoccus denitrificans TaxID=266 RepID=A0A533I4V4_PARDE|nr:MAG: hypothetical protein DI616_12905 [Paracoccus denitrificans]
MTNRLSAWPAQSRRDRKLAQAQRFVDGIFDQTSNPDQLSRIMSKPAPDMRYVIFFTPRSSSTRLNSAIRSAGGIGDPKEWLNPKVISNRAARMGAANLEEYVQATMRSCATGRIFGVELTWRHLDRAFGDPDRFVSLVEPQVYFWLIRRDIVAQAVSLTKIMQVGLGHSVSGTSDALSEADKQFSYDEQAIRRAIDNIHTQEIETCAFFDSRNIRPDRLSYEQLSRHSDEELAAMVSARLAVSADRSDNVISGHQKIGSRKNDDYAERFQNDNAAFVDNICKARASLLAEFPE